MDQVDERYRAFFRAVQAFNRQPADVRRRVVRDYFPIVASDLPDGPPRERLRLYGLRAAGDLRPARDAG